MMMAMETPNTMLDRSMMQQRQKAAPHTGSQRATKADKGAMRRWSLRGTADTRSKTDHSPVSPPPPPPASPPAASTESEKEKRKRSRSVDMSPLQSSLRKAPAAFTVKLTQYAEVLGLRDAVHRYKSFKKHADENDHDYAFPHHPQYDAKVRRVHFPSSAVHFKQVYDRPETTDDEKAQYHYSRQELIDMVLDAKESLARETRFSSQPENTIFEQGFLTLPHEKQFFHHKRYYCLLTARALLCYASPAHAAKYKNLKCKIPILKVQECSTMSCHAKIATFGAHLPATLSLMFFVTRADGERVLLAAETKARKKSWVHTLQRLTQVREGLPACVLRQTSTDSTASTATATSEEDVDDARSSLDEEEKEAAQETKQTDEEKAVRS